MNPAGADWRCARRQGRRDKGERGAKQHGSQGQIDGRWRGVEVRSTRWLAGCQITATPAGRAPNSTISCGPEYRRGSHFFPLRRRPYRLLRARRKRPPRRRAAEQRDELAAFIRKRLITTLPIGALRPTASTYGRLANAVTPIAVRPRRQSQRGGRQLNAPRGISPKVPTILYAMSSTWFRIRGAQA
jgi:hypothetical protein